jgi:hypothetical protein
MALRPPSLLDAISCGAALVLASLAGIHAAAQTMQEFARSSEAAPECRRANANVLDVLRPLVVTEAHVDTHVFRNVLSKLELARGYCSRGDSDAALAIYGRLQDNLSRYARDGAWPQDGIAQVTTETPLSPRAAALRYIF